MTTIARTVLVLVACSAIGMMWTAPSSAAADGEKVSPWVASAVAESGTTDVLVILAERADLRAAAAVGDLSARRRAVRDALWETAQRSQLALREWIDERGLPYRPFYIVNAIHILEADAALVAELADRPDVARVESNPRIRQQLPELAPAGDQDAVSAVEWNISRVGAEDMWNAGFTGQGVVIGNQDTGFQWDHPALRGHYRGWNGSTASHDYNWHDAIHSGGGVCGADSPTPCDDYGHGTLTLGVSVGDDGGANRIGVAPGARWIGCRNMNQGVGTPATYLECFEFFLAPYPVGGSPAQGNTDLAPDVTNNSWTCPPDEGCSWDILQAAVEAQRAAGILTVAAAGNAGPGCSTVSSPPAIYDATFTVGASDSLDDIAWLSSRGPVTVDGSNRLKPDITAPGLDIRSSVPGNGYSYASGTSLASPHVAGAVALLWSASPALRRRIDETESILGRAAAPHYSTDCGDPGMTVPNSVYGWGRVDALPSWEVFSDGFDSGDSTAWPAAQ